MTTRRRLAAVALSLVAGLLSGIPARAADMQGTADTRAATDTESPVLAPGFRRGRATGFPLPRFTSLKSARAHMRVGPSTDYPTAWVYSARGLPLEIIEEYGNWRQVRDQDGASGWMFAPLLSGNRTAVVGPWLDKPVPLRSTPSAGAGTIAELAPKVRLDIRHCDGTWCDVSLQTRRLSGYVEQAQLWGVYPGERVD